MDRLTEYAGHHPWLAGLAVAAALAVLVYELRLRAQSFAALPPQEAIRLMNQGATVLDLRAQQAFRKATSTARATSTPRRLPLPPTPSRGTRSAR